MTNAKILVMKRADGKWAWHLWGENGSDIVATDGGQGYENKSDAEEMARKVVDGRYAGAEMLYEVPPR